MGEVHKWSVLVDDGNTKPHIRKNNPYAAIQMTLDWSDPSRLLWTTTMRLGQ